MQSGGILIPPFVVRIFKSTVFLQIYVPLTLQAFESYLGWKPTANDILKEVSRYVTVPPYIAEAIRRDMERLQS
jgi:hypothetical protein